MYFTGSSEPGYRFTGQELDDTGWYYYGARYYSLELARFLQPDPLYDGPNRYMYVQGNPVRYVDPSGLRLTEAESVPQQDDAEKGGTKLGNSKTVTMEQAACTLATAVRIARTISGDDITLEQANSVALKLGLFSENEDGELTMLSTKARASLIAALTGERIGCTTVDGTLHDLMQALMAYDASETEYYATGRIGTHSADFTEYYEHSVNINEVGPSPIQIIFGNYRAEDQPISDTSPANRTTLGYSAGRHNALMQVEFFWVIMDEW